MLCLLLCDKIADVILRRERSYAEGCGGILFSHIVQPEQPQCRRYGRLACVPPLLLGQQPEECVIQFLMAMVFDGYFPFFRIHEDWLG